MGLVNLALKRPITILMVVLIITVVGGVSFGELPLDLFPDLELPMVVVYTEYEGAGPEEVENMVTRTVEEAVASLGNLKNISSRSSAGSSVVIAEFNWGTNMDFASLDLRENIDFISGFLPDEAGKPMVLRFDPAMMPIMQFGISGDMGTLELTNIINNMIKNRLERIEGVASVNVTGDIVSEVEVKVDLDRLALFGVPLNQLMQGIMVENLNFVGGNFSSEGRHYYVRTLGQFRSLEEMGEIVVGQSRTGPVHLKDLADINFVVRDEQVITRMNGEPVVSLSIRKQSDANTVMVSRKIKDEMRRIQRTLPGNITFSIAQDQSDYIMISLGNAAKTILIGAFLAVFVLFLFLGSISSTMIIATAMPISIITAFTLMYFNKMNLNIVTLAGLGLGVGMMVDNAIVILENIYRYISMGKKPLDAALEGSGEVAGAITAATLTTVVVFLPVIFVQGLASVIFKPLAWVVSFSLLASLLVALTVIPILTSRMPNIASKEPLGPIAPIMKWFNGLIDKLYIYYGKLLEWSLCRRWLIVSIVIGSLLASLLLIPLIGREFLPEDDSGEIIINVDLPVGVSLDQTDAIVFETEKVLSRHPEIKLVFSSIGSDSGMFSSQNPERGQIYIKLVKQNSRNISTKEMADKLRRELRKIPGADFSVSAQNPLTGALSGDSAAISIIIKGDDLDILQEITSTLTEKVKAIEGTREVTSSFTFGRPEVQIRLDRGRAAALGVSTQQIGSAVRASLGGQVVSRLRIDGKEFNIRVKGSDAIKMEDMNSLKNIPIITPGGRVVTIGQVADINIGVSPRTINRENQVRTAFVRSQVQNRDLGSVITDIRGEINKLNIPYGYTVEFGGDARNIEDSFGSLSFALIMAVLLVYMIMAAQFESILYPLIIMFSLPQAFTGILLALAITGKTLNVPSYIGVIMLCGIVVNNGIVLVDYINTLRKDTNMTREEAIKLAGPVRLRPILMTTVTTILGMLPLAFGLGEGAELQSPLAVVIIGGLTVSTIITLVFVPIMYSLLDDFGQWLTGKFRAVFQQRSSENDKKEQEDREQKPYIGGSSSTFSWKSLS
jgi:HAE1 family hydrophobic/amphiphilic exporter-1